MIDLNIAPVAVPEVAAAILPGNLPWESVLLVRRCGCRAWWEPDPDHNWGVSIDSPWRVCGLHKDALRGVPRPLCVDRRPRLRVGEPVSRENRTGTGSHGLRLRKYVRRDKLGFARAMRRDPTPAERRLWAAIRNNSLGFKFRQQAIVRGWIVDFWCPKVKLVVEVDGAFHQREAEQADWDEHRDASMRKLGITVLRVTNANVLMSLEPTLGRISQVAQDLLLLREEKRRC